MAGVAEAAMHCGVSATDPRQIVRTHAVFKSEYIVLLPFRANSFIVLAGLKAGDSIIFPRQQ